MSKIQTPNIVTTATNPPINVEGQFPEDGVVRENQRDLHQNTRSQLEELTAALQSKQSMLLDKLREYSSKQDNTNEYLEKVRANYQNLYSKIKSEKETQLKVLTSIRTMLDQTSAFSQMEQPNKEKQRRDVMTKIDQLEIDLNSLL
jgi:uncharacterized coiled-coil DUF342 family protein